MKGTSKVIMGATLVMVVSLAMVLGLILVLLAELYCSLLLRRRRLRANADNTAGSDPEQDAASATSAAPATQPHQDHPSSPPSAANAPLSSFYAHGVLQAPRSLLFPAISFKEDCLEAKKQLSKLHHRVDDIETPQQPEAAQPQRAVDESLDCNVDKTTVNHFVYISNPVYENAETPFETPDTSPSRLETAGSGSSSGSSGEDDEAEVAQPSPLSSRSSPATPPLTPMKKLPAEACSVSLRDARSLATSGSDSNSNNGRSSSSSGSPCTSPSW